MTRYDASGYHKLSVVHRKTINFPYHVWHIWHLLQFMKSSSLSVNILYLDGLRPGLKELPVL